LHTYKTDKTALLLIVTFWRYQKLSHSRTNSDQDKRKHCSKCDEHSHKCDQHFWVTTNAHSVFH